MTAADDRAMVKGFALLSYLEALRARPTLAGRVMRELEARRPESHRFFAGEVYANQWYPRAELHALFDAMTAVVGEGDEEFRGLGARAAEYQIGRIYRVFLAFATPAPVFQRAGSIWDKQSTAGRFVVVHSADDHLIGELDDPTAPEKLPLVMAGWSDRVVMMLRRRPTPTVVTDLGAGRHRFRVAWS
ncbi:MAG: hypothetical protein Q8S73_44455 [Deltaproteobacteria bacterium]|nr:hypothetical protein [Myxococcales bacterium]MDP3221218.1 hypothetical protein [Deltaproteobacteria bacterium]